MVRVARNSPLSPAFAGGAFEPFGPLPDPAGIRWFQPIDTFQIGLDPRSGSFGLGLPGLSYSGPLPGGNGTVSGDLLSIANPFTGQFSNGVRNLSVRGPGYDVGGSITAGGQLSPAFLPALVRGLVQNPNDPLRALLDAASTSRFALSDDLSGSFTQGDNRVGWAHRGYAGFDGPDRLHGRQALGLEGRIAGASFAGDGAFGFDVTPNRQTIAGGARGTATLEQPLMFGGREVLPAGTRLSNFFAGYADRGADGLALGLRNVLGVDNADVRNGALDTALSANLTPGSRAGAVDARGALGLAFSGQAARDVDLGRFLPGVPLAFREGVETRAGANLRFDVRDLSRDGAGRFALSGDAGLSTGFVTTDDVRLGPDGPVLIPKGTAIDPTIAARFEATQDGFSAFLRERVGLATAAIDTPLGRLPGFRGELGGAQQIDYRDGRFRGAGDLSADGILDSALKLGPFELAPAGSRLLGELRGAVDVDTKTGSGSARIDGLSLFAGKRDESRWGFLERGLRVDGRGDFALGKNGLERANGDVEAFTGVRAGTPRGHRGLFAESEAGVRAKIGVDYDGGKLRRAEGDLYATAGGRVGLETKHGRTSVGASVRAGGSLGFSAKADKDGVDVGAKAFIGAGAGVELRHDIKGKDGKDNGHVSAKAEALVGLGFDAKFKTEKKDGKLSWQFDLGAALGVGLKISFGGSINLPQEKQAAEKTKAAVERAKR